LQCHWQEKHPLHYGIEKNLPELECDITCIKNKKIQTVVQEKCTAVKYINHRFSPTLCTHAYTNGSVKGATGNVGGVYIKLTNKIHTIAVATNKYCNRLNAETAAQAPIDHKQYAKN
jgi:hypothetical protein